MSSAASHPPLTVNTSARRRRQERPFQGSPHPRPPHVHPPSSLGAAPSPCNGFPSKGHQMSQVNKRFPHIQRPGDRCSGRKPQGEWVGPDVRETRLWSLPWAPGTGGGFASILLVTRRPPGLQTACGFPSGRRSYLQLHLLCSTRINWKTKAGLVPKGRGPPQREGRGWGRPRAQRTALPRGGEASGAPARSFRITCVPHAGVGRGL